MTSPDDSSVGARMVLAASLRRGLRGLVEIFFLWPGMCAVVIAYAATAASLYGRPYPNLWGVVAAVAVGTAWYASPVRKVEAKRRERKRVAATAPEAL